MSSPATDFLGSGIAFPYRVGARGLPDLVMASGKALVSGVVHFLLDTAPGDLPWDPGVGMDPETLRLDATDRFAVTEAKSLLETSLAQSEPRLADVRAEIHAIPSQETLEAKVTFRLIAAPIPENAVRLPADGHGDVLRETLSDRLPIQGFQDAFEIVGGFGTTGNE